MISLLLIAQTVDLAQEPERIIRTGHPKDFVEVTFSPDSKILVGAGQTWTKVWDARTGKELRSLASGGHILFSRNGRVLAVSSQGRTELRDVHTGKVLHLLNGQAATFSPDDKMLATTAEKEITLWDVKTGRQRLTISRESWDRTIVFASGGRSVGAIDRVRDRLGIRFLDVRTGEELRMLPAHNIYALSPDGKIWASETDISSIKLWDVATGKELRTLTGYFFYVDRMAFSPDGRILASGITDAPGAGKQEVGIALWDVETGKRLRTLTAFESGFGGPIAFSPDGEVLAGQILSTIQVCEVDTGKELLKLQHPSFDHIYDSPIAFSPDGRFLATADGEGLIKLWNIATLRRFPTPKTTRQR